MEQAILMNFFQHFFLNKLKKYGYIIRGLAFLIRKMEFIIMDVVRYIHIIMEILDMLITKIIYGKVRMQKL